jgi:hypothetical protein
LRGWIDDFNFLGNSRGGERRSARLGVLGDEPQPGRGAFAPHPHVLRFNDLA